MKADLSISTSSDRKGIDFHQFRIEDREMLDPFFRAAKTRLCEYSFAVQYCWQKYNRSTWAIVRDMLVIRFEAGGHYRFTCPVGSADRRATVDVLLDWLDANGHPPSVDFVFDEPGCLSVPAGLIALPDPDNHDYIYSRQELANLPGRRFARKRNHISALSRSHQWEVRRVQPGTRTTVLFDYVEKWAAERELDEARHDISDELVAVRRAIEFSGVLGLEIFELTVDGQIAGLSIAERTHPDMYTIHFEKASIGVRGSYQALCSGAASLMPPDIVYINREQDMGISGLRKTKRSWNPVRMEPCWKIRPIDSGVENNDSRARA